jgi:hypothetical protein
MFMFRLKILALFMLAIGVAAAVGVDSPNGADLPPGPALSKARTGCLTCHDAHIILQQRLSKAAWGKEVDKMIKWGAIVSPSDRDALVEYFSTNFPPDKPPYVAQRSASLTRRTAKNPSR